ncbi:MAG: hypothetical protein ACM3SS_01530 [Rhodospirillaceae bacterium]
MSEKVARVPLLEELRIEARLVPNRRGELYNLAADRIRQLESDLSDMTADYLRRHKDACDRAMRIAELERELKIQDDANEILTRELAEARKVIAEHNADCDRLCVENCLRSKDGQCYEPNCPRDWKIDAARKEG